MSAASDPAVPARDPAWDPAANPYFAALDGLDLPDPVAAFYAFCRAREQVRANRETGAPPPWTNDRVLRRGRFLNVFREDDRGTRAILRLVRESGLDGSNLPALVRTLFFARWCNRDHTLDALRPRWRALSGDGGGGKALRHALETLPTPPWCNVTAYPVDPVHFGGRAYSRLDAAVDLFVARDDCVAFIIQAVTAARRDVAQATRSINAVFRMGNDFPIFMAVMDMAWFRPDLIDPASDVPVGIGAVPFLARLQAHMGLPVGGDHRAVFRRLIALQPEMWPEAKRGLQPIDIEYLCCECRKYFSYVNGTKQFEGKNAFVPGRSARLAFELPAPTAQTKICVVAGGPCSGKSTLCAALRARGYRVEPETAEELIRAAVAEGRTVEDLRRDAVAWQMELLKRDIALFDGLPAGQWVFADTSVVETVVFSRRAGIELGPNARAWMRDPRKRYRKVFFLAPLEGYEQTSVRSEERAEALAIGREVREAYEEFGYRVVHVPAATVEERCALIEKAIQEEETKAGTAGQEDKVSGGWMSRSLL